MFADQLRHAIEAAPCSTLPNVAALLWRAVAEKHVTEAEAEALAALIEVRQAAAPLRVPVAGQVRPATLFPPRRPQRPPERSVAIERRRRLAASGPLPPVLAARFTTGELACLRIVADEVRLRGSCRLFLDAIAARSGTSRSTAKNALRQARTLGLIEIEERRQHGAKSLSNVVRIIDREWTAWLKRGPGIGVRKFAPTDTSSLSGIGKADSSGQILDARARFERGATTRQRRQSPA